MVLWVLVSQEVLDRRSLGHHPDHDFISLNLDRPFLVFKLPETSGQQSMQAGEVATFLTSNPHLLNRTEKMARRHAGSRPLRRCPPVRGINRNKKKANKGSTVAGRGRELESDVGMDETGLHLRLSSN